ncbi:hypothetical protein QR680_002688 [Steinernema hermaphroditum]|uniref:Chromo domain-containing protein n=1 Tax=Steinernema hermaphroditum TaxID=289476 RepID=A0AA39H3P1_9BILA|nr:hypothetical protein QR680_002688 [Steinernema hermaphroditum]
MENLTETAGAELDVELALQPDIDEPESDILEYEDPDTSGESSTATESETRETPTSSDVSSASSSNSSTAMETVATKSKKREYEVEKVTKMAYDVETSEVLYLVKWAGYETADNTWEPAENLQMARDAIDRFLATRQGRADKAKVEEHLRSQSAGQKATKRKADTAAPPATPLSAAKNRKIDPRSDRRKASSPAAPPRTSNASKTASTTRSDPPSFQILNVSRREDGSTVYKIQRGHERTMMSFEEVMRLDPMAVARHLDNLV